MWLKAWLRFVTYSVLFCSVLFFYPVVLCSIMFYDMIFYMFRAVQCCFIVLWSYVLVCSILSALFYYVLFCSVLFHVVTFCWVLLCSVLFCCVRFCASVFYYVMRVSVWLFYGDALHMTSDTSKTEPLFAASFLYNRWAGEAKMSEAILWRCGSNRDVYTVWSDFWFA